MKVLNKILDVLSYIPNPAILIINIIVAIVIATVETCKGNKQFIETL